MFAIYVTLLFLFLASCSPILSLTIVFFISGLCLPILSTSFVFCTSIVVGAFALFGVTLDCYLGAQSRSLQYLFILVGLLFFFHDSVFIDYIISTEPGISLEALSRVALLSFRCYGMSVILVLLSTALLEFLIAWLSDTHRVGSAIISSSTRILTVVAILVVSGSYMAEVFLDAAKVLLRST